MTNDETVELFARSCAGECDALNSLIEHYRPAMVRLANKQLASAVQRRLDASDIVQETCLEVYRDFEDFNGTEEVQFVAWIKQILHHNVANAFRDHVHTQKRTTDKEQAPPVAEGTAGGHPNPMAAKQSSPSARAVRREAISELHQGLDRLPSDQREAVRLRHLEGWSLQQLAEHFGRSEVAVAGLLKRGMHKLRDQMTEE